ncbi:MAG: HEPN domain-containing protein [Ignavibacteriales bacterium]|nr:HEPN domain-containing protein [Ignavibacteriales bacterium]
MSVDYKEWIDQADYDIETAKAMIECGRYFYAVFMCHLSIEKALKGLYYKETGKLPPKIHKLTYFVEKLGLQPEKNLLKFIIGIDDASVATRYPESLKEISKKFKKKNTSEIFERTNEVLRWIKEKLTI